MWKIGGGVLLSLQWLTKDTIQNKTTLQNKITIHTNKNIALMAAYFASFEIFLNNASGPTNKTKSALSYWIWVTS